VFVTTARLSKAAREYAERASKGLVLVDGVYLTRLMVRYGVGLQLQETFTLQQVDEEYFED
jgi:restriction system protein